MHESGHRAGLRVTAPVIGLILAGGLARRMGGGDKPLRLLGDRTLLSRVVACVRPQCDGLWLSANGDPARFATHGLPVLPDAGPGSAGPLAGLLAGLERAATLYPAGCEVVTVAGDTPFLPGDLVDRLRAARKRAGAVVACAASADRTHPVVALWPTAVRDDLRAALGAGERKVGRFLAGYPNALARWRADPIDPFFNVNTPADLEHAAGWLAAGLAG